MSVSIGYNVDGYAMPDIEHWVSYDRAMAGSVIADVSFSCPFFTSVFSDFLIFAKGGLNLINLIINELRYLTKITLAN